MNFQVYWSHQGCKYDKSDIISEDIFSFGQILKKWEITTVRPRVHTFFEDGTKGKILFEINPLLTSVFKKFVSVD